ncbi:MAG TPA: hypothetical protein VM512_01750 [Burkholderiaceae bacterium]|nr:hypothetical protein [Burkholderiaceae bacterium]
MKLLSAIFEYFIPPTDKSAKTPRENAAPDATPRAFTPADKGAPKRLEDRYPEVHYPRLHKLCREMRALEKQVAKHKWTYEPDFPAHPDDARIRKFFPHYHPLKIRWVIEGERELERKKEEINFELFRINLKSSDEFVIDENKLGRGTGGKRRTRKEARLPRGKASPLQDGTKAKGKKVDAVSTDSSNKEATAHTRAAHSNKNVRSKKSQPSGTLNQMKSGDAVIPSSTARTRRQGKTPSGSPRVQPSEKRDSAAKNGRSSRVLHDSGGELSRSSSGGGLRSSSVSSELAVVSQTFTVKSRLSDQQSQLSEDAAGLSKNSRQRETAQAGSKEARIDEEKMQLFNEALPGLRKIQLSFLRELTEAEVADPHEGTYSSMEDVSRHGDWSVRVQAALQTLAEFYCSAIAEYKGGGYGGVVEILSNSEKIDVYLEIYTERERAGVAEMERIFGSAMMPQGSKLLHPAEIIGVSFDHARDLSGKTDIEEIRAALERCFYISKKKLEDDYRKHFGPRDEITPQTLG